jgi:pyruvate dehydrogenase E1 component
MIPFFLFYSIFGCQRAFDLMWAAADAMARGFLIGGISGRTTLAGEGLQHQDGHSHLFFYALPHVKAYDPAFAYEMAVIVREGLRRMFGQQENLMYYITMMNEFYEHPAMPEGVEEGILKGIYRLRPAENDSPVVTLFGSGTILNEVINAQQILKSEYNVEADVWSVTSYKELYWDGIETERWNLLHPNEKPRQAYLSQCFQGDKNIFVAASDYVKALPCSIAKWLPGRLTVLGTDGFGRSDTRQALRKYFGVDTSHIVVAALQAMVTEKKLDPSIVTKAFEQMDMDADQIDPLSL